MPDHPHPPNRSAVSPEPSRVGDGRGPMHDSFSNAHRRAILHTLADSERPQTVEEIANRIVDRDDGVTPAERDGTVETADPSLVRELRAQAGLLAAVGLVGYEPGRDVLWLCEDVEFSVSRR